jgi:hypothetical protein
VSVHPSPRELQPFSQRTLLGLIGLGAVAFLAMAYFMVAGEGPRESLASPTSTSRSAVGFRAFVELLRHFDMPVAAPTEQALGNASLRIVLAPRSPLDAEVRRSVRPVLIVLPKWLAYARPLSDRIAESLPIDRGFVQALAREIAADIEVVRPADSGGWKINEGLQGEPTLSHPQLVRSPSLCPLVANDAGMLIARLCARPAVVVLADPDLLANHGLWRGDNAVLAMSLVAHLRRGNGPVVALEAVSDQPPPRSIWRLAISPPFVLITLAALLAVGIALWSAALRFGPAAAEEQERSPGIITLIDVAARLLRDKGEGGRLLRRYADLLTLDLGRRLHAPQRLQGVAEIGRWLDAARRTPGTTLGYGELVRRVDAVARGDRGTAGAVAVAVQWHRWREDMLNGR